jgi:EmrB/QacA subfamily drug resistance transporter
MKRISTIQLDRAVAQDRGDARTSADNQHRSRRWVILAVLAVAQLMVVLDATVVNVALPSAQAGLRFSDHERQLIITAYMLAFGSVLLLGGKLSDLFGRKRMLIIGSFGFAAASAIGGAAQSFAMLASSRALQGLFAALLAPAALALLTTTFTDPRERGKAFGIFGAISSCGASTGLLLGGALTQIIDWRAAMYVNAAFAAVAVAGGFVLLTNEVPIRRPRLDLPGTAAASLGLLAVVFGLSHAEAMGWADPLTIAALAASVPLLALFAWIEGHVELPLLPLRLLADRRRAGACLAIALAMISMFGVFLFLTYYLQQDSGYSPVETGAAFLPLTLAIMVTAIATQTRLLPRFGPRRLVTLGMVLGAAAMLSLTKLGVHSSYASAIGAPLLVLGVGSGLVIATSLNTGTAGVKPSDAGVASATINTSQQVGCAIGTALLSTVAASATSAALHGHAHTQAVLAHATIHGYTTAFTWSAAIFALGATVAARVFPSSAKRHDPHASQPALAHPTTTRTARPAGRPVPELALRD